MLMQHISHTVCMFVDVLSLETHDAHRHYDHWHSQRETEIRGEENVFCKLHFKITNPGHCLKLLATKRPELELR